jgi:hypothetical protein
MLEIINWARIKLKDKSIHFHLPSILEHQQFLYPSAQTPSGIVALLLSNPPTANQMKIHAMREREGRVAARGKF